jgi:hypothetical protein
MTTLAARPGISMLGGGFGGVYAGRHLERLCGDRPAVEIVAAERA